jgi:FkbM family methyltransferase
LINLSIIAPDTVAGKIVRLPLRLLPRKAIVPILQGPMQGKKWIVGSSLHRCWLGSYELEFQKALAKELRSGSVFYDVGANVGFYSLLAAQLVSPGMVFAFEPVQANLSYLRAHLEINRIDNVKVLGLAIADKCGTSSFVTEATRAMGRLTSDGGTIVSTYTLDRIIQEGLASPPDCIKMDIEGAEFSALLGARECFLQHRPLLFLATHGQQVHEDCCRLLREWKYTTRSIGKQEPDRGEIIARPAS